MDGIANAVSDSCVPQIIPDIEPQTVDGKTVIVVTVEAGKNRPYYLKSKGKDNGTYIRVAGTSRQAFPEKIKELEMEGARISWDELTCVGYPVSEDATEKLCQDIESFRKKAGMAEHSVKKEQLINWKILKQSEGQLLATNAYALLTSDYFPFSKTQCAVFKGTDRAVFLDKREFTGPIYTQIEEAVDFVLRSIRLVEAWGSGIKRIFNAAEEYGLPKPKFQEFDNMFRVELFRNNSMAMAEKKFGEDSEKVRRKDGEDSEKTQIYELTDTQKRIVELLRSDKQLSAKKIAEQLGLGSRSIEKNIKKLKTLGFLVRHGSPKNGYWEVTECEAENDEDAE